MAPEERYGSAEALAEDLERWQRGEPITARPVGQVERLWRRCRRNRAQAATMTLAAVALVLGTAISLWFALDFRNRGRPSHEDRRTHFSSEQVGETSERFAGNRPAPSRRAAP